jgi:putative oxidoreductase
MTNLGKFSDQTVFIGRLFFSSMFLLFAYGKLTGYAGTVSYMTSLGVPAPSFFTLLAIIIELGGGLLMLVGYQTRVVALGLAICADFSLYRALPTCDFNQYQHFMKNMAIVGGALAFVAFGGGAYSLDASKSSKQLRVT